MSKVDALRAMREARYERLRTATVSPERTRPGVGTPASSPVRAAKKAPVEPSPTDGPPAATEGQCGHRSMNGRACTRPLGHEQKHHRYG
jgi:hypothetical protein